MDHIELMAWGNLLVDVVSSVGNRRLLLTNRGGQLPSGMKRQSDDVRLLFYPISSPLVFVFIYFVVLLLLLLSVCPSVRPCLGDVHVGMTIGLLHAALIRLNVRIECIGQTVLRGDIVVE